MARDLSRPPAGWSNREGKGTLKAWRSLSPGYRAQVVRARERGYSSIYEMTTRRASGRASETDQAMRAESRTPAGRYVTPLGAGRWNFYAHVRKVDPDTGELVDDLAGRRALQRNMERAARLDNALTASVVDQNGLTAKIGGHSGVRAQDVLTEGDGDALTGLRRMLRRRRQGGSADIDALGSIVTVSMFVFPLARRRAA